MSAERTAATARVLLIIDAVGRSDASSVSDLDLARLAYFVDAFSPLWGLLPLERYRLKVEEPRSLSVRRAMTRLVLAGVVLPSDIRLIREPAPHLAARYRVVAETATPIIDAIARTEVGRREIALVDEVVYAAAGLLEGDLDRAVAYDAAYSDPRLGPADVIDLSSPVGGTTAAARLFTRAASSRAHIEAELTHMYLAHIQRCISRG